MSEPTPEEVAAAQLKRNRTFSASNAARFMQCHASANLHAAIPGYESPVIDKMAGAKGRGTSMHEVLENVVHARKPHMRPARCQRISDGSHPW